jgi:hypothetical protein
MYPELTESAIVEVADQLMEAAAARIA